MHEWNKYGQNDCLVSLVLNYIVYVCTARSLASVAYRKSLDEVDDDNVGPHFDFFTADLAEDLGALYGPALDVRNSWV